MWQKTQRPTLHDRSGTLIGLGLAVLFLGILSVGTALFRLEVRDDRTFSEIRRAVIANYSRYIFKNQENISLAHTLLNIESSLRSSLYPRMNRTKVNPVPVLNMMLGIREKLANSSTLQGVLFFFFANVVTYFIMIGTCFVIDKKSQKFTYTDWNFRRCLPRDILLDFRGDLEIPDGKEDLTTKVCALDRPAPPEPLRSKLLWPLQYPRPAFEMMLFFLCFTLAISLPLLANDADLFTQFGRVLDYCTRTASFGPSGAVWEYIVWVFAFIDLVVFSYTTYSLALVILDGILWTFIVEKPFTPILLD